MFRFGKPRGDNAKDAGDDLLAEREEEEFEASVRAARERAAGRAESPPAAPAGPPDEGGAEGEIEWSEQQDVYRPARVDARAYLRSLGLEAVVRARAGQSIVLMRKTAYVQIEEHLRTDLKSELGGLLGGEALYDPALDLFLVVVEVALPALHGDGTPTSFVYTPEAWQAILPGWQQMRGDQTIVGSYHSHPGMGVFLSSVDRTTQADVFPHDWQVAMVVDPVANTSGLFIGVAGKQCPFLLI
jgi:26S proteasome regulatory subunit N11